MFEISIIIPVYNTEQYLRTCIESVIHNTIFHKCEVILINDGSTDHSKDIIQKYVEEYDNICEYTYSNSGISAARNRGIEKAEGKYLFFLDSDDFLESDYLEKLYLSIEEQKSDIVFAGFSRTKEKETIAIPILRKQLNIQKVMDGCEYLEYRMDIEDWENQAWCALYRKSFLTDNNLLFCREIKVYEDILFTNLCLLYAKRVYMLPNYGYFYRIRPGSLVQQNYYIEEIECCMKVLEEFIKRYDELNLRQQHVAGRLYFHIVSMILYRIGEIDPPDKNMYYHKLSNLKVRKQMKKSISCRKERIKWIIFCLNWRLFYFIVKR